MPQATPRLAPRENAEANARLTGLQARRAEVRAQLEAVTDWRGRLVQERHNADATNNTVVVRELDARIAELGQRSNRLESEMLSLDDQIANLVSRVEFQSPVQTAVEAIVAARPRGQVVSMPPIIRTGIEDEVVAGIMAAEALGFVLLGIVLVRHAFRRGKREGLASGGAGRDVTQLQQSVDAIALEVERISENQRFVTRLLNEGAQGTKAR